MMRGKIKLLTTLALAVALYSCGGGGGGGTTDTSSLHTTNPTTTTTITSGTAYAYDSALTNGTMSISAVDLVYQEINYSDDVSFEWTVKNGMSTIKIDNSKFKQNFYYHDEVENKDLPPLYVRICADGTDTEGNFYFAANVAIKIAELRNKLGFTPDVRENALCVLIPYDQFDPENNSYFANPYTDFVDWLISYNRLPQDAVDTLISKVDNDLGITYKNVAHDSADADSYITELKNALGIQYGKDWEWKARFYKAFYKFDPSEKKGEKHVGNAKFIPALVKPTRITSADLNGNTQTTCYVAYWDDSANDWAESSTYCWKLDNDFAVEYDSGTMELLINSGQTDASGNTVYIEVSNPLLETEINSLVYYAYGIPDNPSSLTPNACWDKSAKEDVYIDNVKVEDCYLDSTTHEIVCQFSATVSTTPDSTNDGKLPECDTNLLNAGMNGDTIYAQGYLETTKNGIGLYGEDIYATLYKDLLNY